MSATGASGPSERSVIFDLDGTLWDTVAVCAEAWNIALKRSGRAYRTMTPADVRGAMGLAADDLRARVFPDLDPDEGRRLVSACFAEEIAQLDSLGATFFPGVREGLPRLSQSFSLYVVSNCDAAYLDAFFRVSRLGALFKDALCHGQTGLSKGHNLKLLMERNSIGRGIYVGDTLGDQQASAFAGIPFIFARYGFGQCARYDGVIDSFHELERELGRAF